MIANYIEQQTLFEQLITSDNEPNILLFQGESGSGKSHLVEHCLSTAEIPSILIKLQGSASIATLFTTIGSKRGWHNLPHFTHTVANLVEQADQAEDPVWRMGMRRHLDQIGKISDLESRLSRYQLLTDAWFADCLTFEQPFLLAVDAYEKAPTFFDRWFKQEFLPSAATANQMRVLVSGQKVPELHESWSFCASLQDLKGIHEAEAWMQWAQNQGYQVPSLEYMAGIVRGAKGNPSEIVAIIENDFAKTNGRIQPKESLYQQRKRLRENIINSFNLSELKDICFDLEINYESLPGHDHLNGFVRELLAFTNRTGRLNELIEVLATERDNLEW